jgi:transcriptional regulator with XRE-family HTH domain
MKDPAEGPEPVDIEVGERVRLLRKQRGISQSGLGEAIGVSFQQVQKYERGSNRISISMATRIAQCLETTVADLIGEQNDDRSAFGDLAGLMSEPGALDLLRGYAALPRGAQRRAIVDLVTALAAED